MWKNAFHLVDEILLANSHWSDEDELVGAGDEPHDDLDGEPGVAHALHVHEGIVRVGLQQRQSVFQIKLCNIDNKTSKYHDGCYSINWLFLSKFYTYILHVINVRVGWCNECLGVFHVALYSIQGWAKEWSLGLEYVSFVKLRHSQQAACDATNRKRQTTNLGTTL